MNHQNDHKQTYFPAKVLLFCVILTFFLIYMLFDFNGSALHSRGFPHHLFAETRHRSPASHLNFNFSLYLPVLILFLAASYVLMRTYLIHRAMRAAELEFAEMMGRTFGRMSGNQRRRFERLEDLAQVAGHTVAVHGAPGSASSLPVVDNGRLYVRETPAAVLAQENLLTLSGVDSERRWLIELTWMVRVNAGYLRLLLDGHLKVLQVRIKRDLEISRANNQNPALEILAGVACLARAPASLVQLDDLHGALNSVPSTLPLWVWLSARLWKHTSTSRLKLGDMSGYQVIDFVRELDITSQFASSGNGRSALPAIPTQSK